MALRVVFDVDGCLIDGDDHPRDEVIRLLRALKGVGVYVVVHSGGGKDYAEMWVRRLWLEPYVDECMAKHRPPYNGVDISVDDETTRYGTVQVQV